MAIIKAIRSFMPYNRLLISKDGYLIPLDGQYFRVDPKNLGFRYGGEITCVGIITNIFGEDANPNDSQNVFATLQYAANSALKELLPTTEKKHLYCSSNCSLLWGIENKEHFCIHYTDI